MKGKRGQFFAFYLVILTVSMCFLAILIYLNQMKNIENSIVSPISVLRLSDEKKVFEIKEEIMIRIALKTAGGNPVQAKEEFINMLINGTNETREFIFSNLYFNGTEIAKEAIDEDSKKRTFLNIIYDFQISGQEIKVTRKEIGKRVLLKAEKQNKINFAEGFIWRLDEKVYFIRI